MNGANEFFVFLVCVTCGIAGGFLYDFLYCVRYPFQAKWVRYVFDALFWVLFAGIYLFVAVMTGMPSLRFFTFLGCIGGLFLYLKSFHKIVAFFARKVYNAITKRRKDRNVCPRKTHRMQMKKN